MSVDITQRTDERTHTPKAPQRQTKHQMCRFRGARKIADKKSPLRATCRVGRAKGAGRLFCHVVGVYGFSGGGFRDGFDRLLNVWRLTAGLADRVEIDHESSSHVAVWASSLVVDKNAEIWTSPEPLD